jgi:hypothetical protein
MTESQRIAIHENYGTFRPKVKAARIVSDLLDTVPEHYLAGLGSVILSSQTNLPRRDRRKAFWSRSKKVESRHVQGYYSRAWKGQPAFIQLYLDKIYAPCAPLDGQK